MKHNILKNKISTRNSYFFHYLPVGQNIKYFSGDNFSNKKFAIVDWAWAGLSKLGLSASHSLALISSNRMANDLQPSFWISVNLSSSCCKSDVDENIKSNPGETEKMKSTP